MSGHTRLIPVLRSLAAALLLAAFLVLATGSASGAATVSHAVAMLPATSVADFAAGTHDGTAISESDCEADDGGQLRLAATREDLFLAATLDTMWTVTRPSSGYLPEIVDGELDVQERDDADFETSAIETRSAFTAGVVVEMRAVIHPGSAFVNLGFTSSTASPDQWLYFSTRGSGDSPVPLIMTSMHTATSGTVNVPTVTRHPTLPIRRHPVSRT